MSIFKSNVGLRGQTPIIFASGDCSLTENEIQEICKGSSIIIAADGGALHALRANITPNIVVGDFDSLKEIDLEKLGSLGSKIIRHPTDKDETDFELALNHALELKPNSIIIIGGLGGRLDHTLGNVGIFIEDRFKNTQITFIDKNQIAWIINGQSEISSLGSKQEIVSLIPLSEEVHGVITEGLRWKLTDSTLRHGKSRSLCNEVLVDKWSVKIKSGVLLVIHLPPEEVSPLLHASALT